MGWCYSGEDMRRKIKVLMQGWNRGTSPEALVAKALRKYPLAIGLSTHHFVLQAHHGKISPHPVRDLAIMSNGSIVWGMHSLSRRRGPHGRILYWHPNIIPCVCWVCEDSSSLPAVKPTTSVALSCVHCCLCGHAARSFQDEIPGRGKIPKLHRKR